ncbi:MAG TPA: copper chaperone PCu(A)C [Stellaceae bacterium]|nr:copper chaperone PCu(A)C [Stellaceae bacterium]
MSPTVAVDQVWSRATPKSASTAAIYMTLTNKGPADDRLIAAATPVAGSAGLHEMTVDANNVMKMRQIDGIEVKTGGSTTLKPGGLHVMLEGLKAPLQAGQSFPVTLTFEKAGTIQVTAIVQGAGAATPPSMGGHDMSGMSKSP